MPNPSPAITFQQIQTPTSVTIGPAYASKTVGMMNVNSGQTNPIALANTTDPSTGLPFPGATAPSVLQSENWQYLQAAGGYENQGPNRHAGAQPAQNQWQFNGNQACNAGQQNQVRSTWYSDQINNQCMPLPNGVINPVTGQPVGTNGKVQFTLYGSQAIYFKNTYCAANPSNPMLGGNATADRALFTVVSIV